MAEASSQLQGMFAVLGLVLAGGWVVAVRTAWRRTGASAPQANAAALLAAAAAVVWMGATLALAASGVLTFEGTPPTMVGLIALNFALAISLALSRVGARLATGLPLWALVAAQSFRLPLELAMHRAATEGVMPPQMSYSGLNFDIVTGIAAVLVAVAVAGGWAGRRAVGAWNVLGAALLLNVLVIAFLSAPLPIRAFTNEPANVCITQAPFVWLPTVMVFTAIVGHIVVWRRLRLEATGSMPAGDRAAVGAMAGSGRA